jgi:N utilization substance protein A
VNAPTSNDEDDDEIRRLMREHVPEVANGTVAIKAIARERGVGTTIVVYSESREIDPIGLCVGLRGDRLKSVAKHLCGERVCIVRWSEFPNKCIVDALYPLIVRTIVFDEVTRRAVVTLDRRHGTPPCPENQILRLAGKAFGWKIEVLE